MTLDDKIQIKHGNDSILVDRKDFNNKIRDLFDLASELWIECSEKTSTIYLHANLNDILKYKDKPEEELKKLYIQCYVQKEGYNPITFVSESLIRSHLKPMQKARGTNYSGNGEEFDLQ